MKQRKHTKQLSGAEEIPAARVQIGVCRQSSFFEVGMAPHSREEAIVVQTPDTVRPCGFQTVRLLQQCHQIEVPERSRSEPQSSGHRDS
jgi:hypothetical protein